MSIREVQFYRPQNEVCEGYVFTGVCLSTGGGSRSLSRTETPRTVTSGRYASYWNAFLFYFRTWHFLVERTLFICASTPPTSRAPTSVAVAAPTSGGAPGIVLVCPILRLNSCNERNHGNLCTLTFGLLVQVMLAWFLNWFTISSIKLFYNFSLGAGVTRALCVGSLGLRFWFFYGNLPWVSKQGWFPSLLCIDT